MAHESDSILSCHVFLKGYSTAPRYTTTWDVGVVLKYLRESPDNHELTFQQLTHKLVMLMALANADRCSDLAALDINSRYVQGNGLSCARYGHWICILPELILSDRESRMGKGTHFLLRCEDHTELLSRQHWDVG